MRVAVPILLSVGIGLPCLWSSVAPASAYASNAGSSPLPAEATLADLAQRYLAGDTQATVSAVARWDEGTLEAEAKQLLSAKTEDIDSRDASLRAAALVIAEAAGRDLSANQLPAARWKLECAANLVDAESASGTDLFARRFYLLSGLALHAVADIGSAYAMLNRGLRRFDQDPGLQLAMGSVVEMIAGLRRYDDGPQAPSILPAMAGGPIGRLHWELGQAAANDCFSIEGVRRSDRCMESQTMDGAEARYAAALALQPGLLEAHLRLGRVRLLRGNARDALRELDVVVAQSSDPFQRHLAYLFQGAAREELGDFEGAVSAYEAATREAPQAQSALIALGRACSRLGEGARAQDAFARAFRASRAFDPWWLYLHGQPRRMERLLVELRGLVR
jgi:tetratricopeptide (TPR) repeat protein